MISTLEELKLAALRCTRCGSCQVACPVHKELLTETSTARGKIFLLRRLAENPEQASEELAKISATCCLCKACEARCPSGIKTQELIMSLRKSLTKEIPLPWAKRLAFKGIAYKKIFDVAMRFGRPFQSIFFKNAPNGKGKIARIPLPAAGLNKRRLIPKFPEKPLRYVVPMVSSPDKVKARVVFFPGCMMNYVYTDAAKAVIDVLNANHVEVILAKNVGCCGTPAFSSGDFANAASLAKTNVEELSKISCDAIITACASCGSALRDEYDLVLDDEPTKKIWQELRKKVFDFSEYLVKIGFEKPTHSVHMRVSYHDPCHLVRGLKVAKQPRTLLQSIPHLQYVEMKDASTCCGCAGAFSATNYELSCKINSHKIDNIISTKANVVATGCSACRMHIADGLQRHGQDVTVLHTAQILAKAYGK